MVVRNPAVAPVEITPTTPNAPMENRVVGYIILGKVSNLAVILRQLLSDLNGITPEGESGCAKSGQIHMKHFGIGHCRMVTMIL